MDHAYPHALPMPDDAPEEEEFWESVVPIRLKWVGEEAETLQAVIAAVEHFLADLHTLQADGYQLLEALSDGYGFLRRPAGSHSALGRQWAGANCSDSPLPDHIAP